MIQLVGTFSMKKAWNSGFSFSYVSVKTCEWVSHYEPIATWCSLTPRGFLREYGEKRKHAASVTCLWAGSRASGLRRQSAPTTPVQTEAEGNRCHQQRQNRKDERQPHQHICWFCNGNSL